ncbi:hypothetical protein Swit_2179 [Rhizorhabdus wittichii RW1]|uniref:Uncharacterized protein n=1 Tax=Rhizorhabdus wittichii (strain DSM 6014 / CCUG 31198 / JCM 15750 / NBRC 105917 / EY 4224 / RW1) TaxID=392499 RepID=A0A9J9LE96_RHIWR|nr:hypothetical protein Swit_2179 [Rhizorhabdus wittichii RW1]
MDIVARLKMNGQNFSAELGKVLGDAERKFGNSGSVIGRNLGDGIGGGLQTAASRVPVLGNALAGLSGTALVTAAGLGAVTLAMAHGVTGIEEYEGGVRRLDAALRATGNTTGLTRDQLIALANDMEGAWVTPAEDIMAAEQVLASFGGVAGSVFERAIAGAADLSEVFGGDLSSNAEKVGTVLQNLAQGEVKGLERGFKFLGTETLNSIGHLAKVGKTAEAQEALLTALEERIGGSKEAGGKGLNGAFFRLGESINGVIENLTRSTGVYEGSITWVDALTVKVNKLADSIDRVGAGRTLGSLWMGYGLPDGPGAGAPEKLTDDPYGLNRPGLSLGDIIARKAAGDAYESAEAQRKAEDAREAAEKASKKAREDREREAEREASDLARRLEAVRDKYGTTTTAARDYADALADINRLTDAGKLDGTEAGLLRLEAYRRKAAADTEAMRRAISATGATDLRDLVENGDVAAGIVGEKGKAAIDDFVDYYHDRHIAAIEDMADIMTDLIGGKAGRLIGDLISVAGGGRANNSALNLLLKWKGTPPIVGEPGDNGEVAGSVDKLGKHMEGIFGLSGEFTQSLGRMLAGAGLGAAAGSLVGSSQASQFGAMAGGALGEKAGDMLGKTFGKQLGKLAGFAGPLGSIAGGLVGSAIGGLLGGVKWGASTISFSGGEFSAGKATGNSGSARQNASASANSVVNSLERIVEQLGGTVLSSPNITIGQRHGDYRVNTGGTSLKIKKGAVEFDDDQQGAVEYAIRQMLAGAVINGISQAAKNVLNNPDNDLEEAVAKAGYIEAIPKALKARLDPVGAAIDALNDKWEKTVEALREGGAGAEQMAEAQRLYNLELEDVKINTKAASASLNEFLKGLKVGSSSPLSLRDQEAAAKAELQPFLDRIAAGSSIDQDAYQSAAQTFLDIERQLYGSTTAFFTAFDQIQAATAKAIATIDNAVPISDPAADPFAEKTATATQTSAQLLDQISGQLQGQSAQLAALLEAFKANGGGFGFIGGGRAF